MNLKVTTAIVAASLALAACDSTTETAAPAPAPAPMPDPAPTTGVPNGVTASGSTISFGSSASERTVAVARANQLSLEFDPEDPDVVRAEERLADAIANIPAAQALRDELAATVPDLDSNADSNAAEAIVLQLQDIAGFRDIDPALYGRDADIAELFAEIDEQIATRLPQQVERREADLVQEISEAFDETGQRTGEIVLADGTVLQTESFRQDNVVEADGQRVPTTIVAAYEEDAQGNITRVAFLETSGADYVPTDAEGTFSGSGSSVFAVQVDGGFFQRFEGNSDLRIDLATESGDVDAFAVDGLPDDRTTVTFAADVVFNPTTGQFTTSTGEFVYANDGFPGGSIGGSGLQVLTASDAQIIGQLHGDMTSSSGADYTGVFTANSDALNVVGAIIGNGSN